jgi:CHAT domain-containing protein
MPKVHLRPLLLWGIAFATVGLAVFRLGSLAQRSTAARFAHRPTGARLSEDPRAAAIRDALNRDARAAAKTVSALIRTETGASDVARGIARSRNPDLLNDLAAVLWTRGRDQGNAGDFVMAFEAAERSWMQRRSPASAWNRALSLEALHLRKDAAAKWAEYLAVESDHDWTVEAREHLRRLDRPAAAPCQNIELRIDQAAARNDLENLSAMLTGCSDRVRVYGEEVILARWATAGSESRDAESTRLLAEAKLLGAALADASGEHLLQNSVRAIESASVEGRRGLAEAHALYAAGRADYAKQNMTAASERMVRAEERFLSGGSEFAARACFYGATAQYFMGHPSLARKLLAKCATGSFHSPALSGDIDWGRGVIDAASGAAADALASYQTALESFRRVNEADNVAALHTQLAILYMLMGENREAWRHRERALALHERKGLPDRRLQILLLDVARAASADGCPLAAILVQSRLLERARAGRQADFLVNALQYRVRYLADAGLAGAARKDLNEAEATLPIIAEPAIRQRSSANVTMARAYLTRTADPASAVELLQRTIDDLRRVDSRLLLPDLYVELARAYAAQQRFPAASHAIAAAAQEIAFLNARVGIWDRRRAHLESQRRVRQAGLEIFAQQHSYDAALDLAEQFDGQLCAGPQRVADLRLPADTAVVKYGVLADTTLIWVIAGRRVTPFVANVSARALQSSLEAINDACTGRVQDACRGALASLYRHLIAPARAVLPSRLVIVPDDFLAAVPFAALYDETAERYLVEDHTIVISRAPQCADVGAGLGRAAAGGPSVIVGNPWPIDGPLPALPSAEREARRVARRHPGARLLLRGEATKQQFLAAAERAEIIHFAGHGEANLENPELSTLFLAMTASDNGRLSAPEIAESDLRRAHLVVLAACRSNVGAFSAQGALSLASAFLRAGAHNVVATLWNTDDRDAEWLLSAFHAHLQRGLPAAEALRAAQIDMLRKGNGFRSPLTWAAYQIVV